MLAINPVFGETHTLVLLAKNVCVFKKSMHTMDLDQQCSDSTSGLSRKAEYVAAFKLIFKK